MLLYIHTVELVVLLSVRFLLSGNEVYDPRCFLLCRKNVSAIDALVCIREFADKLRLTGGGVAVGDRDRFLLAKEFSSKNIDGSIVSLFSSVVSAYLQHFRT